MIGAIAGDVIGSLHEGAPAKAKDFPLFVLGSRFMDDTVLTVAVASALRQGVDFSASIRRWGRRYPHAGYGGWFRDWLVRENAPSYHSFGNGSAMRVEAIRRLDGALHAEVLAFARQYGVPIAARRYALPCSR